MMGSAFFSINIFRSSKNNQHEKNYLLFPIAIRFTGPEK